MPKIYNLLSGVLSLVLCAVIAQPNIVQAQEQPVIDPQVIEILQRTSDFLAGQRDISVNWFASQDTVVDGREKITTTRNGYNLLSRDEGFFSYVENGLRTREFYFDGTAFQIVDVDENAFVLALFSGSFDELAERVRDEYDLILPIWSVLSRQPGAELIGDVESAAYLGLTRVAGRAAHHLALSDYDGDWQVWVATDPEKPELLMLVGTDPYTQGWPQYRVYFSDWNYAPEIGEGVFTYIPDADAEQMNWPKVLGPIGRSETNQNEDILPTTANE